VQRAALCSNRRGNTANLAVVLSTASSVGDTVKSIILVVLRLIINSSLKTPPSGPWSAAAHSEKISYRASSDCHLSDDPKGKHQDRNRRDPGAHHARHDALRVASQ
jgi:hypothetical protein